MLHFFSSLLVIFRGIQDFFIEKPTSVAKNRRLLFYYIKWYLDKKSKHIFYLISQNKCTLEDTCTRSWSTISTFRHFHCQIYFQLIIFFIIFLFMYLFAKCNFAQHINMSCRQLRNKYERFSFISSLSWTAVIFFYW